MKLAPVVMFVYNRADHFMQTYEAISKCKEAVETDLYVFSDGARNDKDIEKVNNVRTVLNKVKDTTVFRTMEITESPVNKGLAISVITGVTQILEKHGKVIVVEDDCKTSPYFLKYMNQCLDYYENNKSIGSIAGYIPELQYPDGFKDDIFLAYRSCSWGWATWRDRWDKVDWKLEFMKEFYCDPKLIRKLNSNGNDRFLRLYRQTKGNGSSWSVRFGAHLVRMNQLTVYPKYSYVQNIGCDESGVHSKAEDAIKMKVDLSKAIENPQLKELSVNKEIQKIMKKHYSAGFTSDIKRALATKLIIAKERIKG